MIEAVARIHERATVIETARTPAGRFAIWLAASALVVWHSVYAPWQTARPLLIVIPTLALTTAFPGYRRPILSVGGVLGLTEHLARELHLAEMLREHGLAGAGPLSLRIGLFVAALLAGLHVGLGLLRRFGGLPAAIKRAPVASLHFCFWVLLFSCPIWLVVSVVPALMWRASYLVKAVAGGQSPGMRSADHLFHLLPVYGSFLVPTPLGKGAAYLARHEAKDAAMLAKCQLSGLKLLMLAAVWELALMALGGVDYGQAGSPPLDWLSYTPVSVPRLDQIIGKQTFSAGSVVASLYLDLIATALNIAIFGHVIVGCIRLSGFRVFRHVYRPLLAENVAEFWNRWTYYYKELLVDFFFYPTFLRLGGWHARIRLFGAVFSAAFLGNMYFTILWEAHLLANRDLERISAYWGSRAVYCFLLALGIWVSMLRQERSRKAAPAPVGALTRARRCILVATFYAVIHVWAISGTRLGPVDRFWWLLSALF